MNQKSKSIFTLKDENGKKQRYLVSEHGQLGQFDDEGKWFV